MKSGYSGCVGRDESLLDRGNITSMQKGGSLVNSYRIWPKLTLNGGRHSFSQHISLEVGTVSLPSWHLYSPGGADNHQRSKNIILSGDGPYGGKWCGMKE